MDNKNEESNAIRLSNSTNTSANGSQSIRLSNSTNNTTTRLGIRQSNDSATNRLNLESINKGLGTERITFTQKQTESSKDQNK